MTPENDDPDERLMQGVRRGERRALGELYDRHSGALYTYLHRWTGDPNAAEDLMHDSFLRVARPEAGFDGRVRFRTWLFRIARNLATDRLRRLRFTEALGQDQEVRDASPSHFDRVDSDESRRRLERALRRIPAGDREILLLRAELELSHREIATELGCSEGAARVRLHRAVTALRQAWTVEEVQHG